MTKNKFTPFFWLIILIAGHLCLLINSQFIAWPENLTWPYFNLNGLEYYKNIFILYTPLYWWTLTGFYKLFGISIQNLQMFSYLVVILTDLLLWKISPKKITSLIIYIPLQIYFEGNGIWVDHLLAPILLLSYWFLNNKKYFWLGLSLGLALLIKQTAIYFTITVIFYLIFSKTSLKKFIRLLTGLGIPFVGVLGYLGLNGTLLDFYRNAVDYILFFHTKHPLQSQWPTYRQAIVVLLVLIPAIISLTRQKKLLLLALLVVSSLGIFTRFEYFHFQSSLPFLAIGLSLASKEILIYAIFMYLFFKSVISSWHQELRFFDKTMLETANIYSKYVPNKSRTLFINYWDQEYFLTKTLPLGNYFVPSTPWTMDYATNQEMIIDNLEKDKTKYVFYNRCFAVKNTCYEPLRIKNYLMKHYQSILELPDGTSVLEYDPMGL